MRSASRRTLILALVGLAFGACTRDSELAAPPAATRPESLPDVSAPSSPPGERPDVLIVAIDEQPSVAIDEKRLDPLSPVESAPPEPDAETPVAVPTYRTAAHNGRAVPEIPTRSSLATPDAHPVASKEDRRRRYTVREGDWLVQISREQYGSASHAEAILEANRERIADPDRLVPGQELVLP